MQATAELIATARRIARSGRRRDVRETIGDLRERFAGTPAKRARLKKWAIWGGPPALLAVAAGAFFLLRPVPQPDYRRDSLKRVFNYTLLTDEFNRLPVEKRLELIGQLVERLKGMSAGESVVLAAFAAGIAGEARKHIEENASRLAIDLWDKYALDYARVSPEDRAAYLDRTLIEFMKTMETVSGEPRDMSDSERIADVKKQIERDREFFRSGKRQPSTQGLARMFRFMNENVGGHATPDQRARGQVLMRDMMRHFRGNDAGPPR